MHLLTINEKKLELVNKCLDELYHPNCNVEKIRLRLDMEMFKLDLEAQIEFDKELQAGNLPEPEEVVMETHYHDGD